MEILFIVEMTNILGGTQTVAVKSGPDWKERAINKCDWEPVKMEIIERWTGPFFLHRMD